MLSRRNLFVLVIIVVVSFIVIGSTDLFTREVPEKIQFTGKEDHSITLEEAAHLTLNYREQSDPDATIAGFFGKEAVMNILTQSDAVGIRYYYGIDDEGQRHIVLVGVDAEGNDLVEGLLAERSSACPPWCSEENELNTTTTLSNIAFNK